MLVINVITQPNPLYHVELWAESLPLPLLWGQGITAHQFNDDALGRVWEDLTDHGHALLATLGPRMPGLPCCILIRRLLPCMAIIPIKTRGRRPRSY